MRDWIRRLPRNPTAWVVFGLTVLSFLQRPGRTTFDTKLDLAVDPAAFLGRALHLWNPQANGGELQNQAYGYLFPMGPFFATCQAIGLPPWVAQRLWCATLLSMAFVGTLLLARALKIGSEPARYVGAVAYALAPRILTEIGPVSAEMTAAVLLPWVMLPLVRADRFASPRRAAGLSALAVLGMGGVNGAVVVMALVLPGLWLISRKWTREHRRLVLWWFPLMLAAMLWWALPLALLGQYSLPFVDYVESATNTTSPTSLFQVLRGTNQWVAYVVQGQPWWPSGFLLVDNAILMIATALVAGVGLYGLVRAGLPQRLFLVLGVLTGVTLLTIGYVGTLSGPLAEYVRHLLDGPLAPLRNVHKFEPGLRLPLVLAFMHAVTGPMPKHAPRRLLAHGRLAIGTLLVLVVAAPAWLFTLRPGPGWAEIPDYWRSAMSWLGEHDPQSRTLMLPGTGFGEYTWGKTIDEPAQALARSPWALRSQIPLGSEGNIRLMDAVEDALGDGRSSPGLADFLARSGHKFLLLRNDIDRSATNAPPASVLRAALARSPGISRLTGFGPLVKPGEQPLTSGVDLDAAPAQALEVYQVDRPVPVASAVSTSDLATVSGSPESLLDLLDSGLLQRDRPAILTGDGGAPDSHNLLITDGLRTRERNMGRVRDNLSQTLTPDERARQNRPVMDLLPFPGAQHQTQAGYRGIRSVTASSAISFADSVRLSDPSSMPFAAIDGNPYTAWQSSSLFGPVDQWLQVELDTPKVVDKVTLRVVDDRRVGWPVTRIRITTDSGSVDRDVAAGFDPQTFTVAAGLTSHIRVTVLAVAAGRQTGNVAIAELSVPGLQAQRALRVPQDATAAQTPGVRPAFSFSRGPQPRYACTQEGERYRCDAGLTRFGEEPDGIHRLFSTSVASNYQLHGTVLPTVGGIPPVKLDGLEVSASTQLAGDPAASALSAVDGNGGTTWIADETDAQPVLHLHWPGARTLTGLTLTTSPDSGAARPSEVDIRWPGGHKLTTLDAEGRASLNVSTDTLDVVITKSRADTRAGARFAGPPGVTAIALAGADDLIKPLPQNTPFTVPCGQGPVVNIDGFDYATTVSGTLADVLQHRSLTLGTCRDVSGGLDVDAGDHELRTSRSPSFVVQDLWLTPSVAGLPAATRRTVEAQRWDAAHRTLAVGSGASAVLAVPENANDGWVATVDGKPLQRTRVDGWQQAWLLPAGGPVTVQLNFTPDSSYRNRLLIGLIAALVLILVVALPVRRPVTVSVEAGGGRWIPVALVVLLAVLGGMLPIVALIAALLARTLWPPAPKVIVTLGILTATAVSVAGRLSGHGQDWAYGLVSQAAILIALAAVVSVHVHWFDQRE